MNRRQIALKMVLDKLGVSAEMRRFDDRLILQKAVYLIQQAGVNLGYSYGWYLRGPYSRDLTADAFANLNGVTPTGWTLDASVESVLDQIKPNLESQLRSVNAVRRLELLASVLFAVRTRQGSFDDVRSLAERLRAAGKDFTDGEVSDGVRILRDQWQLG